MMETSFETAHELLPASEQFPVPVGDALEAYIAAVNRLPLLSAEEERELARRYREEEDLEAARQLVLSHLRFVVQVARGYAGYGLPLADLIQEGNIGLMKAVKRFDPAQGVRLISFAIHWIRAEIHEFILRNWRIVRVATTKAQRKLFFNLRRAKQRLGWMSRAEAEEVARELEVPTETVLEMEARLGGQDLAFDPLPEDDGEEDFSPVAYLEAPNADPAEQVAAEDQAGFQLDRLAEGLEKLDARSRAIIERRWLKEPKATLHELAAEYGVSAERIRQIEAAAFKKLRAAIEA